MVRTRATVTQSTFYLRNRARARTFERLETDQRGCFIPVPTRGFLKGVARKTIVSIYGFADLPDGNYRLHHHQRFSRIRGHARFLGAEDCGVQPQQTRHKPRWTRWIFTAVSRRCEANFEVGRT